MDEFDQLLEHSQQKKLEPENSSLYSRIFQELDQVVEELCLQEGISRDRLEKTQIPQVKKALEAYVDGVPDYIIEAPTGAGKSIIGLLVSETINKYSSSSTYNLTSSKILQDQLEADGKRLQLDWALLKGQANYFCRENNEIFPKRKCSKMSVSAAEKELGCASTCEYIVKRRAAIESYNTVFSYAYFLTSMNFVYSRIGDYAPFQPRETTIFDECHLITDIVQNMFAVTIDDRLLDLVEKLQQDFPISGPTPEKILEFKELKEEMQLILSTVFEEGISKNDLFIRLLTLTVNFDKTAKICWDHIRKYFPTEESNFDQHHGRFMKNYDKLQDLVDSLKYFIGNNKDIENVVTTFTKDNLGNRELLFRTLNEAELLRRHVHKFTKFSLWMSATLGNIETWTKLNGIDNYRFSKMESDFNYHNSEIYRCKPAISMGMKYKNQNMPTLINRILAICDANHPNERGIIHTGNYEISKELFKKRTSRMIFYSNSQEKELALEKHKNSENGIIVGPSLTEGLDLKDDLSRFTIMAKVPYPSLADDLNKLKLAKVAGWFDWATEITVMQALGRSIRHKNDWAKTYLLDSNFDMVIGKNTLPDYVLKRLEILNVGALTSKWNMKDDVDMMPKFD